MEMRQKPAVTIKFMQTWAPDTLMGMLQTAELEEDDPRVLYIMDQICRMYTSFWSIRHQPHGLIRNPLSGDTQRPFRLRCGQFFDYPAFLVMQYDFPHLRLFHVSGQPKTSVLERTCCASVKISEYMARTGGICNDDIYFLWKDSTICTVRDTRVAGFSQFGEGLFCHNTKLEFLSTVLRYWDTRPILLHHHALGLYSKLAAMLFIAPTARPKNVDGGEGLAYLLQACSMIFHRISYDDFRMQAMCR